MLDTARLIDTPEGVQLQVSPAGPVPRVQAFGIDFLIRGVIIVVVSAIADWLGDFGDGVLLLGIFLLEWLYPVLFEVLSNGATPGKRVLGLRVVHDNGVPVGWSGSMVRNLLRAVDFLPFGYGFGLVSMTLNKEFKRLGDLAAGTIVIYDSPPAKANKTVEVEPLRPYWTLAPEEQVALLTFAERASTLNEARASEVASVLGPIGGGDVGRLRQYAAWIQGER